tara:strand:+ start:9266 stop:9625 length:360 start_codon:yes stop_codon:yes gene_type:complete
MYSCSQGSFDKKEIIGKWKVIEFNANMKDLSPAIIRGAKEIALSSSYEFKKDSTYSFNSSIENFEGKWALENKNIIMTFSSEYEKNGVEKYEVVNLSNGGMTWKTEFESEKTETVLSKK